MAVLKLAGSLALAVALAGSRGGEQHLSSLASAHTEIMRASLRLGWGAATEHASVPSRLPPYIPVPLSLLSSPCQSPGPLFLAAASLFCYSAPSDSLHLSCLTIGLCFAVSCLPLFFLLISSISPLGVDFSAVILPASLLYVYVNISFSHCPSPISTSSRLLAHSLPCFSFVSPLVHLGAPVITSGHNQERLCLCLCSPPHLLCLH